MKTLSPSIFLSALFLAALPLQAGIIFKEDFKGAETETLHGTEPTVTTDGAKWMASANFPADGAVSRGQGSHDGIASLPFIPEAGKVYTLKGKLFLEEPSDSWLALGFFSERSKIGRHAEFGSLWVLHRISGNFPNQQVHLHRTSVSLPLESEIETHQLDVEITLDTSSEENVMLTVNFNGGSAEISGHDIGSLKRLDISAVGLSYRRGCPGHFGSFELSSGD